MKSLHIKCQSFSRSNGEIFTVTTKKEYQCVGSFWTTALARSVGSFRPFWIEISTAFQIYRTKRDKLIYHPKSAGTEKTGAGTEKRGVGTEKRGVGTEKTGVGTNFVFIQVANMLISLSVFKERVN